MKWLVWLLLPALFAACSTHLVSTMSPGSSYGVKTGKVTITGTRAIRNAYISLNDSLIVAGKTFKKLELDSVPGGKHHVRIVSKQTWGRESHNESFNILVIPERNVDIVSNVPSGTTENVAFLSIIGLFASLPFLFL